MGLLVYHLRTDLCFTGHYTTMILIPTVLHSVHIWKCPSDLTNTVKMSLFNHCFLHYFQYSIILSIFIDYLIKFNNYFSKLTIFSKFYHKLSIVCKKVFNYLKFIWKPKSLLVTERSIVKIGSLSSVSFWKFSAECDQVVQRTKFNLRNFINYFIWHNTSGRRLHT